MNDILHVVWPLVSLLGGAFGGWIGVKVAVTRLETQMERVQKDLTNHERQLAQQNEDLSAHDFELEGALKKLDLRRARRQPLRGWDMG